MQNTPPVQVLAPPATRRLLLRAWREADHAPFAAMNADPHVMRYFAALGTPESSRRLMEVWNSQLQERGWSNWAVERRDTGEFIGFVGLTVPPRPSLHFMPCVEIGWRLIAAHWHQGFATEAAREVLRFGFEGLALEEIVSFTTLSNTPSRAVMERLGMANSHEDFDHPAVPAGHPLLRHCLYRLPRNRWLQT